VAVSELLDHASGFGAVVLSGMLVERMRVGDQVGLRLLGPGDVLSLTKQSRSMLLSYADCRAVTDVRLALLGRELLLAVQRWPQLLAALHVRMAEQSDRLAAQLVICQLPRVDQRLLAVMWLLAESWGHVTAAGTSLPLGLTHDLLGGLIGARRSTVTLALGELAERGALIRQDRGWLLLEPPPQPSALLPEIEEPRVLAEVGPQWSETVEEPDLETTGAHLLDTVRRLREEHVRNREHVRAQLERLRRERERRKQALHPEKTVTPPLAPS
jgi:CRP-like cAMP-binding protein